MTAPVRAPNASSPTPTYGPRAGTEAPLRMLMNNLDPEVAEKPWRARASMSARPRRRELGLVRQYRAACAISTRRDPCCAVGQAGGRVPHSCDAPRVVIANSTLAALGDWEHFNELDRQGHDDVRPDDRRSCSYRTERGDRAREPTRLRRDAPAIMAAAWQAAGSTAGRAAGRRAAARRDHGPGLCLPRECSPSSIEFRCAPATSDRQARDSTRRWRSSPRSSGTRNRVGRGFWATTPTCCPTVPPRGADRLRHRPDLRARSHQRYRTRAGP